MKNRSLVGEILHDTYRIERLLVRGGMGSVFEASHSRLKSKRFAVKILHGNIPKQIDAYHRFRREAEITTELGHPHIVEVIDFNETPRGEPYMVMEYLEGETLGARIRREKVLPPGAVVAIATQVGSALDAAHKKGVVHRDIKPDNIFLLGAVDGPIQLKVLDFGISKIKKSETLVTDANLLLGTVRYMSPEQASAQAEEVDEKTDIFAMAAICYEALTGVRPFDGPTLAAVLDQICEQPPAQADLPGPLRAALFHALAKDKAMRTASASEFARELAQAVSRVEEEEEQIPTSVSNMMRPRELSLAVEEHPTTDLDLPRGTTKKSGGRLDPFVGIDSALISTRQLTGETTPDLPLGLRGRRWEESADPAEQPPRQVSAEPLPPDDPRTTGPFPAPELSDAIFAVSPAPTSPSAAMVLDTPPTAEQALASPPENSGGQAVEPMTDSIDGLVDSRRFTGRMLLMASAVGVLLTAALVISLLRASDGADEAKAGAAKSGVAPALGSSPVPDEGLSAGKLRRDASLPADQGPAQVTISLRLTPKDAEVRVDGKLVRKRELKLRRSDKKHQLEVSSPGFETFSRRFVADSSTVLVVALDTADSGVPDAGALADLVQPARRADARVRRTPRPTQTRKKPKRLGDGLPEL